MSREKAARTFGVGATSVNRYVVVTEKSVSLTLGKAPGRQRNLDESGIRLLEEGLHPRPSVSHERRAEFHQGPGVSCAPSRADSGDGQPHGSQGRVGKRADRAQGMRATVSATLPAELQPGRESLLKVKAILRSIEVSASRSLVGSLMPFAAATIPPPSTTTPDSAPPVNRTIRPSRTRKRVIELLLLSIPEYSGGARSAEWPKLAF
jgi:hypothetical protein